MKHNWKIGDAYTNSNYENLKIVGRITILGIDRIAGAEIWFTGGSMEFHTERWWNPEDLIPLVPEYARLQQLDQTINEIYATVEKVQGPICTNPPDNCMPGCPEHQPIDQFDPNIKYQ